MIQTNLFIQEFTSAPQIACSPIAFNDCLPIDRLNNGRIANPRHPPHCVIGKSLPVFGVFQSCENTHSIPSIFIPPALNILLVIFIVRAKGTGGILFFRTLGGSPLNVATLAVARVLLFIFTALDVAKFIKWLSLAAYSALLGPALLNRVKKSAPDSFSIGKLYSDGELITLIPARPAFPVSILRSSLNWLGFPIGLEVTNRLNYLTRFAGKVFGKYDLFGHAFHSLIVNGLVRLGRTRERLLGPSLILSRGEA